MRYIQRFIKLINEWVKSLSGRPTEGIHPKTILSNLISELEKKKKLGIEEKAFAPNFYVIYLNPHDYDELSPFLSGIKEQIINKLMDRIKQKGYRLLSSAITFDIRQDRALERNQVVVESSFIKEKTSPSPQLDKTMSFTASSTTCPGSSASIPTKEKGKEGKGEPEQQGFIKNETRIFEEKRTKYIDPNKVNLEILEGENRGETIPLREGEYTFGRGNEAKILLKDPEETISRKHFQIKVGEEKVFIKDLQSTNGTKVNNIEIEEAELKKGDKILAGKLALKVA